MARPTPLSFDHIYWVKVREADLDQVAEFLTNVRFERRGLWFGVSSLKRAETLLLRYGDK